MQTDFHSLNAYIKVFRAENHKLHSEKETALEELRVKRQAE